MAAAAELSTTDATGAGVRVTGVAAQPRRALVRLRSDPVVLGVAAAVFVVCTLAAMSATVSSAETAEFRAINDTVTLPYRVVWGVMQFGNVAVVPIAALVAAITRRFRLAVAILVGGLLAYWLAKVVKAQVDRGRPERCSRTLCCGTRRFGSGLRLGSRRARRGDRDRSHAVAAAQLALGRLGAGRGGVSGPGVRRSAHAVGRRRRRRARRRARGRDPVALRSSSHLNR